MRSAGININRTVSMDIDVPNNQNFSPVLDVFAWDHQANDKRLLGNATIQLGQILANYYKRRKLPPDAILEEDEEDDEEAELMKQIEENAKKQDKKPIKVAAGNDLDDEEPQEIDLDKIDLTVPWELPVKRKLLEDQDYQRRLQQIKEDEQKMLQQIVEEEEPSVSFEISQGLEGPMVY